MSLDSHALLDKARNCIQLEIDALRATADGLDGGFVESIQAISEALLAGNKLIFTGVGKNAAIGQKLAGTFNSTGATACFLDPLNSLHGDLGLCEEGDLCFLMSNSGETEEMLAVLPGLKRLDVKTVALTAQANSTLAANCDITLTYAVPREACPLNLAPTASTTATIALGDALAMVYLEVRGLTKEDFARYHPAGSLGKSLLLRAGEMMRTGERFATAPDTITVKDAVIRITQAKCGTIALTGADGALTGCFSDGDFRRSALDGADFMEHPVARHMTRGPRTIRKDALGVDALKIFEQHSINDLIVTDADNKPLGIIDGQDLPRLRVV